MIYIKYNILIYLTISLKKKKAFKRVDIKSSYLHERD